VADRTYEIIDWPDSTQERDIVLREIIRDGAELVTIAHPPAGRAYAVIHKAGKP
jgi:hypothetical protein